MPYYYGLSFRRSLPAGRQGGICLRVNHCTDASCVSMTSSGALFSATAKADPYYYGLSFRRSLPAGRQGGICLRFIINRCFLRQHDGSISLDSSDDVEHFVPKPNRTTTACHSGEACLPAGREESAFASIIAQMLPASA